jgi:signal peptidase II
MTPKIKAILLFVAVFAIDQYIKFVFVNGFEAKGSCISLVLAYNTGVAFSMFEFLGAYLKYIQIGLLIAIAIYLYKDRDMFHTYIYPVSLIFSAGISNILDRFIHIGVVDYVYWHCGFDFAIFNLADVMIDVAIVWILWIHYKESKKV